MSKSAALNVHMGEDIDSTDVELEDKEATRLKSMQERLQKKAEELYAKKNARKK